MNKTGSVFDLLTVLIFLFVLGITSIIGLLIIQEWDDNIDVQDVEWNSQAINVVNVGATAFTTMDYMFVFLIVGLVVAMGLSAFYIQTHPAFFVISLIVLVLVVFIGAEFSNVFEAFTDSEELSITAASFTWTTALVDNFPIIIMVAGGIFFLLLYAKGRGSYE
jgi:hypothetical protein